MITGLILIILGTVLFFLPGIFLSYILFPECDVIERIVYSIILASSIKIIYGFFISAIGISSIFWAAAVWAFLTILFFLILFIQGKDRKTIANKHILYIALMSLVGFAFKLWFSLPVKNFSDCIVPYATKFTKGNVPDLGFYTGMAVNHSYYMPGKLNSFVSILNINSYLQIFLSAFVYLGFLYILFKTYKKPVGNVFFAVAIFSIFPIELFQVREIGILLISYITVISLFILFKKIEKGFFIFCAIAGFTVAVQYYTGTMAVIIVSLGFILAIIIKYFIQHKNIKNIFKNLIRDKRLWAYLFMATMCFSLMNMVTQMGYFTIKKALDTSNIKYTFNSLVNNKNNNQLTLNNVPNSTSGKTSNSTSGKTSAKAATKASGSMSIGTPVNSYTKEEYNIYNVISPYKVKRFLGFSAIGWQSIFFLFCGFVFILYIFSCFIRKKPLEESDKDILCGIIPAALLGFAFTYMNYPARVFDYLSFFAILALKTPKKYSKILFSLAFIFIFMTNIYVINETRIFLENPDGEIAGAAQIGKNFSGKIFSDECFVNQLILHNYYNVTGTDDRDQILVGLFYSNNEIDFKNSIDSLKETGVSYIATTKRMRDEYILMLNFPQRPLMNEDLYRKDLDKVYDNGDVEVYSIKTKNGPSE